MTSTPIATIEDVSNYFKLVFPELSSICDSEAAKIKECPTAVSFRDCTVLVKEFVGFAQRCHEPINPAVSRFVGSWVARQKDCCTWWTDYLYLLLFLYCDKDDPLLIEFPVRLMMRFCNNLIDTEALTQVANILLELKELRGRVTSYSHSVYQIGLCVEEFTKLLRDTTN